MPIEDKYVKPLKRIKNRVGLNDIKNDSLSNWYENVFKVWPKDPSKAYKNNPPLNGWVRGTGQKLFKYEGELPTEIQNLKFNLLEELR